MEYRFLPHICALLTALSIPFFVWWLYDIESSKNQQKERATVERALNTTHAKLEASLNERLSLVQGLAAFAKTYIRARRDFSYEDFSNYAQALHDSVSGIRSLQLQPGAVVHYVYPMKGNEAVFGHDLLADPNRRIAVQKAIDDRQFVLDGPVSLIQGGTALIGRQPIYYDIDGRDDFWGFASILLDVEPIYRDAGFFEKDTQGLVYALRRFSGEGNQGKVFYGAPAVFEGNAITAKIELPLGSWELAAIPVHGWQIAGRSLGHYGFSILLALIAGWLVFMLLHTPMQLRRQVQKRTAEYKEIVKQLKKEKTLINAVVDSVPDLIFCKDLAGKYVSCNRAFEAYIGLPRTKLLDHQDEELLPQGFSGHFHQWDETLKTQPDNLRAEEWVNFNDGRRLLLDTLKLPFLDDNGQVVGMIGISRDSTERKWVEQALQASEKKYRELIDNLDEALYRINLNDHSYEFISNAALLVFGYDQESFLSDKGFIHRIVHPDSRAEFGDYWRKLTKGQASPAMEYSIIDAAGHQRWIMQSAQVIRDKEDQAVAVEGICRDITIRRRSERILNAISEAVSSVFGEAFFEAMVSNLGNVLGVDYACIARFDEKHSQAHTLAVFAEGKIGENFSYDLAGSPCEKVAEEGVCVFERNVARLFPEDCLLVEMQIEGYAGIRLLDSTGQVVGIMVLLSHGPLPVPDIASSMLEVFAVRASAELERIKNDQRLKKLSCAVEQSPSAVLITDVNGTIEFTNDAFIEMSGYSREELIGSNPRILKSGEQNQEFYGKLWQTIIAGEVWHGEMVDKRKNGDLFWVQSSIYPIVVDCGQPGHFVLLTQDITERKQKDAHLKMASTVFDTTTEAIVVTNSDNRIQLVNPAFTHISGYEADEVIGKDPGILSSGHHDSEFYTQMRHALETDNHWEGEIWNRRKNGEMYPEWLSIVRVLDDFGQVEQHIALFSDISKRKETEGLLYQQANYDLLTELPNRMLASDRLRSALTRAGRLKSKLAVLHIDIDRFKWINDTYGHDAGDGLLQDTAKRLGSVVRESDTVAHLNGDEFLVILPEIRSNHDAEQLASSLLNRITKPFQLENAEAYLTASIGISIYPSDAEDVSTLMQHADSAMWRAKEAGGNGYRFFTHEMNVEALARAELENDLRQALLEQQFEMFYQPLVELTSGRVTGAEALIRWHHPVQGLILPGQFIWLAEETGLIVPIGEWVLTEVCRQLSSWRTQGFDQLRVSVNLSPRQCLEPGGVESICRIIEQSDNNTEQLALEITENMLMDDHSILDGLQRIRQLGVRLSIDDFGTGYSSLSYLKNFPIDILKIDRSFIKDLPDDRGDAALVQAIISMARSLVLEVVAEGVELDTQREFLTQLNCNYLQGYFFGKPMPCADFEAFVRQYNAPPEKTSQSVLKNK